jgi:hypothetical protein
MEDPTLCPASFTRHGLYRNGRQINKREFASWQRAKNMAAHLVDETLVWFQ